MNAVNHEQDGQNVLFNDGHVDWSSTPFAGANKDNVFTQNSDPTSTSTSTGSASATAQQPKWTLDTILLPMFKSDGSVQ